MEKNQPEEQRPKDVFSGERQVPLGTSVSGTAGAVAGAAAGSPAGPVGVAVGAAIGAVLGTGFERKAEHEANPELVPGTIGEPANPAPYQEEARKLSPEKKEALLDLAVLAGYADTLLADLEETALRRLIKAIGHDTDWKVIEQAAVARNRPFFEQPEEAARRAEGLTHLFTTKEEKHLAREVINDVLAAGPGGPDERRIKSSVKQGLRK